MRSIGLAVTMEKLQTALQLRQACCSMRVTSPQERRLKNDLLMEYDRYIARVKREIDLLRN